MSIDAIGGRKILATIVVLAVGIGATIFKGDVPPNLLTLLQFAAGFFVAGNAVEHVASAMKAPEAAGVAETPPSAAYSDAISATLERLETEVKVTQDGVALTNQALTAIMQRVGMSS